MRRIINSVWLQGAVVLSIGTILLYKTFISNVLAVQVVSGVWAAILGCAAIAIGFSERDGESIQFIKEPKECLYCGNMKWMLESIGVENKKLTEAVLALEVSK